MYSVKLNSKITSGANKDQVAVVAIKSAKLVDSEGKAIQFGEVQSYKDTEGNPVIGIPASNWEYPQFGNEPAKDDKGTYLELTDEQADVALQEMIKDAGGKVRLVENYNDATRTAALNKGKTYIRTKEEGDPIAIVEHGIRLSREFSWSQAERISNKSVREGAEKLADEVDSLSPEEIKARLRAMLGK